MKSPAKVNPVPEGYHTVSPWIISGNSARVIDFMTEVFDAEEVEGSRFINPDGTIGHAEVRIGDSVILLFDAKPEWPALQSFLRVYVPDADSAFTRAIQAGGAVVTEMTTLFFGDRVGRIRDPFGNIWWIQTHVEDVSDETMQERMANPSSKKDLKYFEESLTWELGKNVTDPQPVP